MKNRKEKAEKILTLIERGCQILVTDKFADIVYTCERDIELRATAFSAVGQALGEELGLVEYPMHWKRFLQRKDCPKYMREVGVSKVHAYYPKISLPQEEHWVTFERPVTKYDDVK